MINIFIWLNFLNHKFKPVTFIFVLGLTVKKQKQKKKQRCLDYLKYTSYFMVYSSQKDSFKFHDHSLVVPLLCILYTSAHNGELKGGWKSGQATTSLKKNSPKFLDLEKRKTQSFKVLR